MRSLVLCEACKHHVKVSEALCPFCGAAVLAPRAPASVRSRGLPGGRAALFLAGTALAPGCADEPAEVMAVPPYGIAIPPEDAGRDAGAVARDAGNDAMTAVPVYGVAIDAGRVMTTPPYGIAIPPNPGRDAGAADAGCPQVGQSPVPDGGEQREACTDAGSDAGHDAGPLAVPTYGVAIDRNL